MRALEGLSHPQLLQGHGASSAKLGQDTIYLCNFRVSVDGEWLCLKELQDLDGQDSSAGATVKGRLADGHLHHPRHLQGSNTFRNSWNGTEGICGRKMNRFYDTSDDLFVGRNTSSSQTAMTNKRFSDMSWANSNNCRCLPQCPLVCLFPIQYCLIYLIYPKLDLSCCFIR